MLALRAPRAAAGGALGAEAAALGGAVGEPGAGPLSALEAPALIRGESGGDLVFGVGAGGKGSPSYGSAFLLPRPGGEAAALGLFRSDSEMLFQGSGSFKLPLGLHLGLSLKGGGLDPGDGLGRGWFFGPDLGLSLGLGRRAWFSAGLSDPFTRLNRPGLPSEALPNLRRFSAGWRPVPDLFLTLGTDHHVDPVRRTLRDGVRVGGAWSAPGLGLTLRAGYESFAGEGLGACAGAGWSRGSFRLAYAWTSGEGAGEARHRLEAGWVVFPGAGKSLPRVRAVADREPGEGEGPVRLRSVLVETRPGRGDRPPAAASWEAAFHAPSGEVLGREGGPGEPPPQILWDARKGREKTPEYPGPIRLELVLLRDGGPVTVRTAVRPGPITASRPSKVLDLPSPDAASLPALSWTLEALDGKGGVLDTASGRGPVPDRILTAAGDAAAGFRLSTRHEGGLVRVRRLDREGLSADGALAPGRAGAFPEGGSWKAEVRAADGAVIKSYGGPGRPPPQVAWDGADRRGRLVPEEAELVFVFTAEGRDGSALEESRPLGRAGSSMIEGLKLAAVPEPQGGKAATWTVQVMDEKGRATKTLSGQGLPPVQIFMERPRSGGSAPDPKVRISYTVRAPAMPGERASVRRFTWTDGKWMSQEVEAPAAEGLARADRSVRLLASGFKAAGVLAFEKLLAGVLSFGPAEDRLGRLALREIENIVALWEGRKESVVCIYGYSTATGRRSADRERARKFASDVARALEKITGSSGTPVVRAFAGTPRPLVSGPKGLERKGTLVEVFLAPKPR